jgi:hypothetical protein
MHKQRSAILLAAAAGVFGTFLPWVNLPIVGAVYGTRGDGWLTMCLYGATILLTVLPDRTAPLLGGRLALAVAPGLISSAIGIIKLAQVSSATDDMAARTSNNPFAAKLATAMAATVSPGIGLVIVAAAGIVAAALALALRPKPATVSTPAP